MLAHHDEVLSKEHVWRFPGGHVLEDAWYLNAAIPGAVVTVGEARLGQLAQGLFFTRSLACASCNTVVGWRFESFHTAHLPQAVEPQLRVTVHENVRTRQGCTAVVCIKRGNGLS